MHPIHQSEVSAHDDRVHQVCLPHEKHMLRKRARRWASAGIIVPPVFIQFANLSQSKRRGLVVLRKAHKTVNVPNVPIIPNKAAMILFSHCSSLRMFFTSGTVWLVVHLANITSN
jgi:hypothetical protein